MASAISEDLDQQIAMTHERLVQAMEARLPDMHLDTKERYFAILSTLVTKLADPARPLRDVAQEMVAETAGLIFQNTGQ